MHLEERDDIPRPGSAQIAVDTYLDDERRVPLARTTILLHGLAGRPAVSLESALETFAAWHANRGSVVRNRYENGHCSQRERAR